MKGLILVESPTKAKTLYRFLQGKYDIEASMGHVRDLPKGDLGVDTQNNFSPKYVIPKDKRKVVEKLKEIVKNFDKIILATDPDREGEAIAYHLYYLLKNEVKDSVNFERIVFHEITQNAIDEALQNPRQIDNHLVSAQTARRVLDRIVGYNLSPLLWRKIKRNLSGGRVQSVVVRLVVEREREIEKFKSETYCRINVFLSKDKKEKIEFALVEINNEKIEITSKLNLYDGEYKFTKTTLDAQKAKEVTDDLTSKKFEVMDVAQKETKRAPLPPFITSTLQQEAAKRFGFSSKKTMLIAQKLYEEGFITYHRTDSYNLSGQFISQARHFVEQAFGKNYLHDTPRTYQTKSKMAQEAHEAIRSTNTQSKEKEILGELGKDFAKLYDIIYKRVIATQMADAIFESTKIVVKAASPTGSDKIGTGEKIGNTYLFDKSGSVLKFDGFLRLTGIPKEENLVPVLKVSDLLNFHEARMIESKTNPPPRYSEANLIATLEENGIGRPSTYAPIISTIQDRHYVEKSPPAGGGKFTPTVIGTTVNDFLVKNFSSIDDIPFTAQMENKLDEIASGNNDWIPMIKDFYKPFELQLESAEKEEKTQIPVEKTGKTCPECGSEVVLRMGRFGKFYACSRFPDCKYKETFRQETNAICPKDGGKILVRKTRKGRTFYSCENYPKCKYAVWKLQDVGKEVKPPEKTDLKKKN
ncbi:MAG: DNA topoisomerase I [Candidatus Levybacteria bacterium RIFCSPHIGHO2_01_FULL_36_15]|nr:MAG: DNA topoisomerase I [Candidatus Levybacteria bacterium RIFCSPHIGHO2_01_FULL_36_15]OGH38607.1 MAG: DNA topoisomerase I [Candidatus Levybacteria bacterium RIFCSPLOWO2_01_FULL_36_10]